MDTFTETLAEPRAQAVTSALPTRTKPASTVAAPVAPAAPVVPEAAPWVATSSSGVLFAAVSREPSSSYRGYSGFPNFDDVDEEEEIQI